MKLLLLASLVASSLLAPVWAEAPTPIDITASKLEVNQSASKATFTGNVVVTQGGLVLAAPTVVTSYAGGTLDTITASGGVTITRTGSGGVAEKATGSTATYSPKAGNITLQRGPSELSGDKLVYNLQTGNAVVTNSNGPVKARFVPGK